VTVTGSTENAAPTAVETPKASGNGHPAGAPSAEVSPLGEGVLQMTADGMLPSLAHLGISHAPPAAPEQEAAKPVAADVAAKAAAAEAAPPTTATAAPPTAPPAAETAKAATRASAPTAPHSAATTTSTTSSATAAPPEQTPAAGSNAPAAAPASPAASGNAGEYDKLYRRYILANAVATSLSPTSAAVPAPPPPALAAPTAAAAAKSPPTSPRARPTATTEAPTDLGATPSPHAGGAAAAPSTAQVSISVTAAKEDGVPPPAPHQVTWRLDASHHDDHADANGRKSRSGSNRSSAAGYRRPWPHGCVGTRCVAKCDVRRLGRCRVQRRDRTGACTATTCTSTWRSRGRRHSWTRRRPRSARSRRASRI